MSSRIGSVLARSRFPWTAIAFGGAAVAGIGALVLANRRTDGLAPPKRVALIGDSYAVGLGPELAKLLPTFKYEGHVGTTTGAWAAHASSCGQCGDWLPAFKPDLVLVSLGVNDGVSPNPTNYQTIVRALHGLGARVVWIEPPAAVNAPAVRAVIASLGVQTIPATQAPLAADRLHPADYQTWANDIAQVVTRG
jgi:lysophospholipase L1-like esterase